jgi:hypothetical protein
MDAQGKEEEVATVVSATKIGPADMMRQDLDCLQEKSSCFIQAADVTVTSKSPHGMRCTPHLNANG